MSWWWPWNTPASESDPDDDNVPDQVNAMLHYTELNLTVGVRPDGMIQLISVPRHGNGQGITLTFEKPMALFIASALRVVANAVPDCKPTTAEDERSSEPLSPATEKKT